MNIWERLDRDHVIIHASGTGILQSHGDLPRRHNQFANFDHEVRRHLAVVEEVIFPWLLKDPEASALVRTLRAEHKQLRKGLDRLERRDKTGHWMEEFNLLLIAFEASCRRHDGLEHVSRDIIDDACAQQLGEDYEHAKMKRLERPLWSWNRVGVGVGAAVGVAAIGAAVVGAVRAHGDHRRHGEHMGERVDEPLAETDETLSLGKVEGAAVLSDAGDRIGRIEGVVIDMDGGRVAYALLRLAGSSEAEQGLVPLPWRLLDHDEPRGSYVLGLAPEELDHAPRFAPGADPAFDADQRRRIAGFYQSDLVPGRNPIAEPA